MENRFNEISKDNEIHVIYRTGNRSDVAAQTLTGNGFQHVKNVVLGMFKWEGPTEKI